jgi:hypothetical protein
VVSVVVHASISAIIGGFIGYTTLNPIGIVLIPGYDSAPVTVGIKR